jgi:hypothetical protein
MVAVLDIERSASPPRMVAATVEGAAPAQAASLHVAQELLDGGEIVLLAIKPSAWFVLFDSARWLMLAAALLIAGQVPGLPLGGLSGPAIAQLAAALAVGRLGIAVLRWAARHYVLTNRRVMRLSGVYRPDILACPLVSIRNTRVQRRLHERLFRLGTIQFFFECPPAGDCDWHEIARADKVHEQVRRAIERALDSQSHR